MDSSYQRRLLIVFLFSFVIFIAYIYFIPQKTAKENLQQTNAISSAPTTLTNIPTGETADIVKKDVIYSGKGIKTNVTLSYSNEIFLNIDTYGARITGLSIDGKWNRMKNPVSMISGDQLYLPGDSYFGGFDNLLAVTDRPVFELKDYTSNSVSLTTLLNYKGNKIELTKKYSLDKNYQFFEELSIKNISKNVFKIDFKGTALAVAASYSFFTKERANSGNPMVARYFDGSTIKTALGSGFLKSRDKSTVITSPRWLSLSDNYFMSIVKPEFGDYTGKFVLVKEDKLYNEIAYGLEIQSILLESGESKNYKIDYYIGPKKEVFLSQIDKSYLQLFAWPIVFNWFMKPIEWLIYKVMSLLSMFVFNWGVIIIILSLLIKLVLSPLSIQAAVSIKRSSLLQPKIKGLQEKYKDDSKTLNEKMAELYKKEGVNPLGGCFPMLLQIPVFFALYRVLATSVELKDATFFWIKDLTQPDTLFKMSIPFLPNNFNLLPIIMTIIQLIQMKLQSMKTTANTQQNAMNTYLMPVIFLFLFWGMPSGLVLYWTVQNIYTIIEQEIINLDKNVRLKKK